MTDLEAAGYAAAVAGRSAAPALDPTVHRAIEDAEVGDPQTRESMKAFSRGYSARLDEELAEVMAAGEGTRNRQQDRVRSAIGDSDVADGQALAQSQAVARKSARFSPALEKYRAGQSQEAESLALTQGPRGGSAEAAETIDRTYRAVAAESPNPADAWRSEALSRVRREYGPGSIGQVRQALAIDPHAASDRDLRNAENDLFYRSESGSTTDPEVVERLTEVRGEMTARGLGPKLL